MQLSIQEHGVMLTGYFHGTSGVWLNVNVDNQTTIKQLIEGLENEIAMLWDHIEFIAEGHGYDKGKLESTIKSEINDIKNHCKDKMNQIYNASLDWCFSEDEDEDFEELPVLIFTIEFTED